MATRYSVSNGGFLQDSKGYSFELSGELTIPVALTLPYRFGKSAVVLTAARATFTTAGTSTYNIVVTSANADGTGSQTVLSQTVTPVSGQAVSVTLTNTSLPANHIIYMSIVQNSGTAATDFTLSLE